VIAELDKDPKRHFAQAEIYNFERWWNEQNETTRNITKRLVADE